MELAVRDQSVQDDARLAGASFALWSTLFEKIGNRKEVSSSTSYLCQHADARLMIAWQGAGLWKVGLPRGLSNRLYSPTQSTAPTSSI